LGNLGLDAPGPQRSRPINALTSTAEHDIGDPDGLFVTADIVRDTYLCPAKVAGESFHAWLPAQSI
jgi:hypothetical protein